MKKAALIINAVGAGLAFVMMIYYGIILGIRMENIAQNEMAALVGVIVVYVITMLLNLLFVKLIAGISEKNGSFYAIAICDLLFASLISGILLFCCNDEDLL